MRFIINTSNIRWAILCRRLKALVIVLLVLFGIFYVSVHRVKDPWGEGYPAFQRWFDEDYNQEVLGEYEDLFKDYDIPGNYVGVDFDIPAVDAVWQPVDGSKYEYFVYSAFVDTRKGRKCIRIIGTTRTYDPETEIFCQYSYKASEDTFISETYRGKVKIIHEHHRLEYTAAFLLCPLPKDRIPYSVSIVSKPDDVPRNHLLVQHNPEVPPDYKYSVCVKPMHNYYNVWQLLEFLEFYRIHNIENFVFYYRSSSPEVECVLQEYARLGIVTVIPWKLDLESKVEIHTEGIFSALNDCLYRTMYRYYYVLNVDIDEYIIPRDFETIPRLIEHLNSTRGAQKNAVFSFRNTFYYLNWIDRQLMDKENNKIAKKLVTQTRLKHSPKIYVHLSRSKFLFRPELVVELGNHQVWEFVKGYNTYNVPEDVALMHHYRTCETGDYYCNLLKRVKDASATRYRNKLVNAVKERYELLRDQCNIKL